MAPFFYFVLPFTIIILILEVYLQKEDNDEDSPNFIGFSKFNDPRKTLHTNEMIHTCPVHGDFVRLSGGYDGEVIACSCPYHLGSNKYCQIMSPVKRLKIES